ncbi:MAG: osmotically inducible protein OsmC [Planctomycetes bacterium]|nr:osmotically inducible protein OsmC [Planctomycetota bacterium]
MGSEGEAGRPSTGDRDGGSPPPLPPPDAICDGGDLDCGSGLLLIIREAMAPLRSGGRLEVRSREGSVREDLPAWCRLVGHALAAVSPAANGYTHFTVVKGGAAGGSGDGGPRAEAALTDDVERARQFTWSARVKGGGGMAATAYVRNHSLAVGQPASFDTADPAPSALEYLLSALGGCLVVGFQWRASRRGIELRQLELSLRAKVDDIRVYLGLGDGAESAVGGHPGLASLEGTLYVDGDADEATLAALLTETVARSPVAQSLLRGVPLRVTARRA